MIGLFYRKIIKPILFLFPADRVHTGHLRMGYFLGKIKIKRWIIKKIFSYKNITLKQEIKGVCFDNPVGLAAGFDYDADLINILPSLGFGFNTVGTVTHLPYEGNPKPMLGRLPKSKSLLVNKGFKSMGVESVLKKVSKSKKRIPLGFSIGATNKSYENIEDMANDVVSSFERVTKVDYFDYFEVNISCPNLINSSSFENTFDVPQGLSILLEKLSVFSFSHPVFIKMHLEKSIEETLALVEVSSKYPWVSGLIFSNLVKDRSNPGFDKKEIESAGRGNFSGKPTERQSNILIGEVYKKYKDRFIIIGCGGIFDGADAYEKIKNGATLVQMITGMIYQGPQVIGEINKELSILLKKDGYKNIKEAIGSNFK